MTRRERRLRRVVGVLGLGCVFGVWLAVASAGQTAPVPPAQPGAPTTPVTPVTPVTPAPNAPPVAPAPSVASSVAATPQTDEEWAQALTAAVEQAGRGRFYGSVLVARGGRVLLHKGWGSGTPDGGAERPAQAETLYDCASLSKMFTAAAALKLAEQGKLSLDDTVAKWFPVGGHAEKLTLRQLLSHRTGLDNDQAIQTIGFGDRDEAVRKAMEPALMFEPGSRFMYSNVNYVVLAGIIEKASGQSFEAAVRERVFVPAGMTSTGFIDGAGLESVEPARLSVRRVTRGTPPEPGKPPVPPRTVNAGLMSSAEGEPWGWGIKGTSGVATTVGDLRKWHEALRGKAVLSESSVRLMLTPSGPGYGMGLFIAPSGRRADGSPMTAFTHTGSTRGFTASYVRRPADGLVVAVLAGDGPPAPFIAQRLLEVIDPSERESVEFYVDPKAIGVGQAEPGESLTMVAPWRARFDGAGGERPVAVEWIQPPAPDAPPFTPPDFPIAVRITRSMAWRSAERIERAADFLANNSDEGWSATVNIRERPADAPLTIREGLTFSVMTKFAFAPEFDGPGKRQNDALLTLSDGRRGPWLMTVEMRGASARQLARQLRDAASTGWTPGAE